MNLRKSNLIARQDTLQVEYDLELLSIQRSLEDYYREKVKEERSALESQYLTSTQNEISSSNDVYIDLKGRKKSTILGEWIANQDKQVLQLNEKYQRKCEIEGVAFDFGRRLKSPVLIWK